MDILYGKRFSKDIETIRDNQIIKAHLLKTIEEIKQTQIFAQIRSVKKIKGYSEYYRIKIGDYRLGLKKVENRVELLRFMHRKDIYRRFPK